MMHGQKIIKLIINRPVEWLPTLIQLIMTHYVECNERRFESLKYQAYG